MGDRSLLVEATKNLLHRLETDRPSTGIQPPANPFTTSLPPPEPEPIVLCPKEVMTRLRPYQMPPTRGKSPRSLLSEFHIELAEDVPSD